MNGRSTKKGGKRIDPRRRQKPAAGAVRLRPKQIERARHFLGRGLWEGIKTKFSEQEAVTLASNVRRHIADLKKTAKKARRAVAKERAALGRRMEQKEVGFRQRLMGNQLEMWPETSAKQEDLLKRVRGAEGKEYQRLRKMLRYRLVRNGKEVARNLTTEQIDVRMHKERYWKLVRALSRSTGLTTSKARGLISSVRKAAEDRVRKIDKKKLTKKERRKLTLARQKGRAMSQLWDLVYELESPMRGGKRSRPDKRFDRTAARRAEGLIPGEFDEGEEEADE